MRVYELAKELNIASKDICQFLNTDAFSCTFPKKSLSVPGGIVKAPAAVVHFALNFALFFVLFACSSLDTSAGIWYNKQCMCGT